MVGGGFSRRIAVLPLAAIEAVEARTDGLGRRFHYGGLMVTASGRRMPLFGLRRLPDPDLLFGLIMGLDQHIPMRTTAREPARTACACARFRPLTADPERTLVRLTVTC